MKMPKLVKVMPALGILVGFFVEVIGAAIAVLLPIALVYMAAGWMS